MRSKYGMRSRHIFGVDVVELQQLVGIVLLLTEPPVDDFLLDIVEVGSGNVVDCLHLCLWVGVKHVGHPFPLD